MRNNHIIKTSPETIHIALLSAYAIGLHSLEAFIPTPVPWLRLGLANIITLTTLYLYGLKAGMIVTLIRIIIRSLFTGTFMGPAFLLSLSGGITSTLAMWVFILMAGRFINPVIVSITGALVHNIVQLFLAYLLFVQQIKAIYIISPVIILFGIITGIFNGIVTSLILKKIKQSRSSAEPEKNPA